MRDERRGFGYTIPGMKGKVSWALTGLGGVLVLFIALIDPNVVTSHLRAWLGLGKALPIEGAEKVVCKKSASAPGLEGIKRLAQSVSIGSTRSLIETLASMGSRVPGYEGNLKAGLYIERMFREIGLEDVRRESFKLCSPVDLGGWIEVGSERFPIHCLYPNSVRTPTTPPEGVKGRLYYAGKGGLKELNYKEVEGAIILLDFDCGRNYLNAFQLGAQAVVFLNRGRITRAEAELKYLSIPANLRRYWADGESARRLLEVADGREVRLRAKMEWREVESANIYGFVRGRSDKLIIISSYYDSTSVVPAVAPGADSSGGVATLLEVARRVREIEPEYTIMFLATGAHFQGLAGILNFAFRHFPQKGKEKTITGERSYECELFIGLDLSSANSQVATTCFSTYFNPRWLTSMYLRNLMSDYAVRFDGYAEELFPNSPLPRHLNAISPPKKSWKDFFGYTASFDSEAVTGRGRNALTIFTPYHTAERLDTPADRVEYMDFSALRRASQTCVGILLRAVTDRALFVRKKLELEDRMSSIFGTVSWFDRTLNPNIPKATIGGAVVTFNQFPSWGAVRGGVKTIITTLSRPSNPSEGNEERGFEVKSVTLNSRRLRVLAWDKRKEQLSRGYAILKDSYGERRVALGPSESKGVWEVSVDVHQPDPPTPDFITAKTPVLLEVRLGGEKLNSRVWNLSFGNFHGQFSFPQVWFWRWWYRVGFRAYALDSSGEIIYAPDLGEQGAKSYPFEVNRGSRVQAVLFPCRSLTVCETVDSRYLTTLDYLGVLGADNAEPQHYGYDIIHPQSLKEGMTVPIAVIYTEPDKPVKFYMSTGLLGVKLLAMNVEGELFENPPEKTTEEVNRRATGKGFIARGQVLKFPAFRFAKDMWVINDVRLTELASYGIKNAMLSALHNASYEALRSAERALSHRDYERFVSEARRSWGYSARGYPDVRALANDTLRGVVFYLVLLLPFSVFFERLVFGAADIRKRLVLVGLVFFAVFFILSRVHPAFKLSSSPYVVLLSFFIFAFGAIVLFVIVRKFGDELRKIREAETGVFRTDVGRLSATSAAVALGISNLRKRKVRTALTCTTLILLTFTALSFTSVREAITFYELPLPNRGAYEGVLLRDRNWRGLQQVVLDYVQSEFSERAEIAPRLWLIARLKGEPASFAIQRGDRLEVRTEAILGLSPREPLISGIADILLPGSRWFRDQSENSCILPDHLAKLLSLETGSLASEPKVRVLGKELTVVGIFNSSRLNSFKDIDNEPLTPVDTVSEGSKLAQSENPDEAATAPLEAFTHIGSQNVVILPSGLVSEAGGTVRSIAMGRFRDEAGKPLRDFLPLIKKFMQRVALNLFVSIGGRVSVYSSLQTTSIEGIGNLAIPLAIGALIVITTMLAAVYERQNEIAIYSSIGLAPVHIGSLFLAEASVFAVIGAVAGYLIGQVVAYALTTMGWLGGITLNYSALSAVTSTCLVMGMVLLSTLYPARKASQIAVPDVRRRWEIPQPQGDLWEFDFPFTVSSTEIAGLFGYLHSYFESHGESSLGRFVSGSASISRHHATLELRVRCWLAPFDLGISQDVTFIATETGEMNIYKIALRITRLSGEFLSWKRMNRGFLNGLRKQFLIWRTLPQRTKDHYAPQTHHLIESAPIT